MGTLISTPIQNIHVAIKSIRETQGLVVPVWQISHWNTLIVKYRSGYSRNSETHMLGSFLLGKSVNSGAVLAGTRIGFGPRHCIGNINLASLPYKSHINQNCPAKLVPLLEFLFPHTGLIFEAKLP